MNSSNVLVNRTCVQSYLVFWNPKTLNTRVLFLFLPPQLHFQLSSFGLEQIRSRAITPDSFSLELNYIKVSSKSRMGLSSFIIWPLKLVNNTRQAALGALAHRLQHHILCKIQNGHQGGKNGQWGIERCLPLDFFSAPVNFCKLSFLISMRKVS